MKYSNVIEKLLERSEPTESSDGAHGHIQHTSIPCSLHEVLVKHNRILESIHQGMKQ
jgi:hypothetical protein